MVSTDCLVFSLWLRMPCTGLESLDRLRVRTKDIKPAQGILVRLAGIIAVFFKQNMVIVWFPWRHGLEKPVKKRELALCQPIARRKTMAKRFHINPEKGPLPCSASTPEGCLYGPGTVHYTDREQATGVWMDSLAEQYGTTGSKRSGDTVNKSRDIAVKRDLDALMERRSVSATNYLMFSNKDIRHYATLKEEFNHRCETVNRQLESIRGNAIGHSPKVLEVMTRKIDDDRDTNAEMAYALSNSNYHYSENVEPPEPQSSGLPFNTIEPTARSEMNEIDVVREVNDGRVPRSRRRNPLWRQSGLEAFAGSSRMVTMYGSRVSSRDGSMSVTLDGVAHVDGKKVPVLVRPDDSSDRNSSGISDHARAEALYTMKVTGTDSAVVVSSHGDGVFKSHRVMEGEMVNSRTIDEMLSGLSVSRIVKL